MASFRSNGSKAFLDEFCTPRWNAGDCISVFLGGANEKYVFRGSDGDAEGLYTKESVDAGVLTSDCAYAIYPYSAANSFYDGRMSFVLPAVQPYAGGTFAPGVCPMVACAPLDAVSQGSANTVGLQFRNACSILKISLYGNQTVRSLTLRGNNGEILCGSCNLVFDGVVPVPEMEGDGGTEVTLDCGQDGVMTGPAAYAATPFLFVLPPTVFTKGFTIEVTLTDGTVLTGTTANEIDLERSAIVPMEALSFKKTVTVTRHIIMFGDSITIRNVSSWMQQLVDSMNTVSVSEDGLTTTVTRWEVVLAGVASEQPIHIASRQGALPVYIKDAFTLPASSSQSVSLGASLYSRTNYRDFSQSATPVYELGAPKTFTLTGDNTMQGYNGCVNPVTVAGVECTLSYYDNTYHLHRNTDGAAVDCPAFTQVESYCSKAYRDADIVTIYMGTNGGYNKAPGSDCSYETLSRFYDAMMEFASTDKFILLGYHMVKLWNQATADYFKGKYGKMFIDLKTEGSADYERLNGIAGAELTPEDISLAEQGCWPASWESGDGVHPCIFGHKVYAQLAFERMCELGYFDQEP